ncbi:MAG: hypothetical protein QOD00_4014 [Blastocatellia bacterium]|jgi:hypothetical protein|nr:hypothetical protein [Blastocatellia bacterium]
MRVLLLMLGGLLLVGGLVLAFAQKERPRRVQPASSSSSTIQVRAGDNLQAAINRARPGDTIMLEAGATFTGPVILPPRSDKDSGWITIRTDAPDSSFPAEGMRVSPSNAALMPKIVSPGKNLPALRTEMNAHHYRLIGLEMTLRDAAAASRELVALGSAQDEIQNINTLSSVPHHLVVDRCYIHSFPSNSEVVRGISLNSASTDIVNSYISEIHGTATDSQAIFSWNGPGPYNIINNYLEGSSENLAFGNGEGTHLVAKNVVVRGNYMFKPLSWRGKWLTKNLFEIKEAESIVIEGNIMENCWQDGQNGNAVVFTIRYGPGNNVDFKNNIIRHAGSGFAVTNFTTNAEMHDIRITNNLIEDIDTVKWGGAGIFIHISGVANVTVDHNTVFHDGTIVQAYDDTGRGTQIQNFVYTNNIAAHNKYGISGGGFGLTAMKNFFPRGTIRRNIIAAVPDFLDVPTTYPSDNFYPASLDAVGFTDRAGGNYRLSAKSRYRGRATDGKDVGCDFDALEAATSGVREGTAR